MDNNKKRKRDSDKPRITYHASNRTFDRLFKEESLNETKEVVRRKLGLASDAVIHLTQLREGKNIDLEDDDDFDAFCALAHSMSSVDVRVTMGANSKLNNLPVSMPIQTTPNKMKTKKNRASSVVFTTDRGSRDSTVDGSHIPPPSIGNRKRKVSFMDPLTADVTAPSITKPKQKKRRDNSGNIADLDDPQTSKTPISLIVPESLLKNGPLRRKKTNQDRREIPNSKPSQSPVDRLGSFSEHDSGVILNEQQKEHVSLAPIHPVTAPTKSQRFREPIAEVVNESSALSNRSTGEQEKQKKKSRGSDARKDLSSASIPSLPDDSGSHPTSTLVLGDIDRKLKKALAEEKGKNPSRPSALEDIPDSSPNLLPTVRPCDNVTKPNTSKKPPGKIHEAAKEDLPFAEQLAGAISKTGEITRKHLAESIAIEKQKGNKRKAKKTQGLEQEVQSIGHRTPSVASSSAAPSSFPDMPKKRRESDSNVDPTAVSSTDINKSKEKSKGEEAVAVNLDLSNEASKRTKSKRKVSTRDDVEAAAADVKGAMSRVLAAMRASTEPSPSDSLPRAGITSPDNTKIETENLHKKVKRPSGKSTLRMSWGPDDFREDERPPVNHVGEAEPHSFLEDTPLTLEIQTSNDPTVMVEKGRKNKATKGRKPNVNAHSTPLTVQPSTASQAEGHTLSNLSDDIPGASTEPAVVKDSVPSPAGSLNFGLNKKSGASSESDGERSDSDGQTSDDSNEIRPIVGNITAYADIDLDALVRGPQTSRLSVADILSAHVNDYDDDGEDVVLAEEEDDKNLGRRATKSQNAGSSDDDDLDSQVAIDEDDDISPSIVTGPPIIVDHHRSSSQDLGDNTVSFRVVDGLGESVEVDETGDTAFCHALAADTAIFQLANTDSEDTGVELLADADKSNVSLSQPQISSIQEKESLPISPNDGLVSQGPKSLSPQAMVGNSKDEIVATEPPLAKERHTPRPTQSRASRPKMLCGTVPQNPTLTDCDEQDDPIEPADDFEVRGSTPVETDWLDALREGSVMSSQSTPKGGMVRRMKNRNGKVPLNGHDIPAPVAGVGETDSLITLIPKQLKDLPSSQEDNGKHRMAMRTTTRSLSRAAMPPPPSPNIARPVPRRRQPGKSTTEQALEADAKLAAKEEKARVRQEKAFAKAATKTIVKRSELKGRSSTVESLDHISTAPLPIVSPLPATPSLDRWATLKPSSPHLDPDSSVMIDELPSSSPGGRSPDLASKEQYAKTAGSNTARVAPPDHHTPSDADTVLQDDPLFILTESQPPFPYSQWNSLDHFGESLLQGVPRIPSPTESADEEEVEVSVKSLPRNQKSRAPYRKLTDITSQQTLFSTPALLRPASFPSLRDKLNDLYGRDGQEEESDPESDSDSDADGEAKSHIPKSRRAGLASQRKS